VKQQDVQGSYPITFVESEEPLSIEALDTLKVTPIDWGAEWETHRGKSLLGHSSLGSLIKGRKEARLSWLSCRSSEVAHSCLETTTGGLGLAELRHGYSVAWN
jgi:hypothetical protein